MGERLGVAALSSPVDSEKLQRGLKVLRSWGYPIVEAPNLDARKGYLAGSDEERVKGLLFLLDQGLRFIFLARGGYGLTRILDRLPWERLVDQQVSFLGYSDGTALCNSMLLHPHAALQFHGPVVSEFGARPDAVFKLRDLLENGGPGRVLFSLEAENVLRAGRATGIARGGNLSMLAAMVGTVHQPDMREAILFLEEVREPAYRIDRMLTQIAAAGMFSGVRAVVSGSLYACRKDAKQAWRDRLLEILPENIPILGMMPFGHGVEHVAFPLGSRVDLDTSCGTLVWRN